MTLEADPQRAPTDLGADASAPEDGRAAELRALAERSFPQLPPALRDQLCTDALRHAPDPSAASPEDLVAVLRELSLRALVELGADAENGEPVDHGDLLPGWVAAPPTLITADASAGEPAQDDDEEEPGASLVPGGSTR